MPTSEVAHRSAEPARVGKELPSAGSAGLQQDTRSVMPVPWYPAGGLVVGRADDQAERDADRIADEVLRRSREPEVDVAPDPGADVDRRALLRRSTGGAAGPVEVGAAGGQVSADLTGRIASALPSGRPLDEGIRRRLEPAFGESLSSVRVHTGTHAAELSRRVSARAFTVGQDIFFGAGEYRPDSAAGQHVLAHEIAHTRQSGADARRLLRRLAYSDDPLGWGNVAVKRSGEGVAGVYFVGPNMDLVVKPLGSTGTVQYSNMFMQAIGLEAPDTVRYAKGSPQGNEIERLLHTATGVKTDTEVQDQIDQANAFLVMEKMSGKSIQTLDDDEAENFLQTPQALRDTGKIMVADAFLGNSDRLVGGNVNLGNFFYEAATIISPGVIRTIDNESKFTQSGTRRKRDGSKRVSDDLDARVHLIEMLHDPANRKGPIRAFLTKFAQSHKDHAKAIAELTANRQAIEDEIAQGIEDSLTEMARVFTTNMDLVRSVGGGYDAESERSRNASTAKATAKYIKARQGGDSETEATKKLTRYVEYRAKRDKTPRGFKWVTKLFNKTGF